MGAALPSAEQRRAERERLTRFIAKSRSVQRRVKRIGLVGGLVVVALIIAGLDRLFWLSGAVLVAMVVGVGYWITAAHITEWVDRLREIDRRE